MGKSLFWYSSEIFFAYFLTEFVGLHPLATGLVLAGGFLVSAIIDLVLGPAMQRFLANAESAGRAQCLGAVASSATLLLFFASIWIQEESRFLYALVSSILFRLAFAAYDIPQNALMLDKRFDMTLKVCEQPIVC